MAKKIQNPDPEDPTTKLFNAIAEPFIVAAIALGAMAGAAVVGISFLIYQVVIHWP